MNTVSARITDIPQLTVLSYGIGQDSWTILLKLALDKGFRQRYAPGRLLVVSSDTGNEHPDTYEHQKYTEKFCTLHGIDYVHITNDMGFHPKGWQTLQFYFKDRSNIASAAFPKTCTDNLKIKPIYGYLETYIEKHYGFEANRKSGFKRFAEEHGRINVLIGIARGEEKRVASPDAFKEPVWQSLAINKVYPLLDIGYDRADCQDYITGVGEVIPPPSNCVFCPFKSKIELLWTYTFLPEMYRQWVEFERQKIANWADRIEAGKNLGVYGKKLIPEVLKQAIEQFGHMTHDQLNEYRMSHGHLCANKF